MKPIYIIAAVPGSGKTHIINQLAKDSSLEGRYLPILHDDYSVEDYHKVLIDCSKRGDCPVIGECPFRASVLEEQLKSAGCSVKTFYLVEDLSLTVKRYEGRTNKVFSKAFVTNWHKYSARSPKYNQIQLIDFLTSLLKSL